MYYCADVHIFRFFIFQIFILLVDMFNRQLYYDIFTFFAMSMILSLYYVTPNLPKLYSTFHSDWKIVYPHYISILYTDKAV